MANLSQRIKVAVEQDESGDREISYSITLKVEPKTFLNALFLEDQGAIAPLKHNSLSSKRARSRAIKYGTEAPKSFKRLRGE